MIAFLVMLFGAISMGVFWGVPAYGAYRIGRVVRWWQALTLLLIWAGVVYFLVRNAPIEVVDLETPESALSPDAWIYFAAILLLTSPVPAALGTLAGVLSPRYETTGQPAKDAAS